MYLLTSILQSILSKAISRALTSNVDSWDFVGICNNFHHSWKSILSYELHSIFKYTNVPTLNIFMAVTEKNIKRQIIKLFLSEKNRWDNFRTIESKANIAICSRYQVMLLNSQTTLQKIKALKSEFSFPTQNHIWLKDDFFFKRKNIHTPHQKIPHLSHSIIFG